MLQNVVVEPNNIEQYGKKIVEESTKEQAIAHTTACLVPFNAGHLLHAPSPTIANANINNRASSGAVVSAVTPPLATVAVNINGTSINNINDGNNNSITPIFGTPPIISPTFIEHKYSANTFKEKFLANLRTNHSTVHKSINITNNSNNNNSNNNNNNIKHSFGNSNAVSNNNNAGSCAGGTDGVGNGFHSNIVASVPMMSPTTVGIDDLCSIQQWSQNYNKNTMYQKTIN
ncbi:signal transducer and activator of transcription B-like [Eurosta solidaginis]|uniref:signal transducer and activator of transcription B-like n=1 Tax=Eurosta solidaginis TaxID=178769 RepID=UPI0035309FC6